jgi:hypothetical protein
MTEALARRYRALGSAAVFSVRQRLGAAARLFALEVRDFEAGMPFWEVYPKHRRR